MSLHQTIVTPVVTYEQPLGLYIDGKWVKGVDGRTFETISPTTEKPIASVHEAGEEGESCPSTYTMFYQSF
jgi:aldehyde dehydrogenase (NAD+)